MKQEQVLFISHDAGRNGAPIVLLHLLRWLKKNADIPIRTLCKNQGPLVPEFEKLGKCSVLSPTFTIADFKAEMMAEGVGLIYSNTVTNGEIVDALSDLHVPVITHVHELEYWIQRLGPHNFEQVTKHTTRFIAASRAVKKNLVAQHGISADRIVTVHEAIPTVMPADMTDRAAQIRQTLNIPADAFVVGGSGTESWRKGKDLFVQLAIQVAQRQPKPPVHFLWVGHHQGDEEFYWLKHDINQAGLSESVHFVGEVESPLDYFATFDVFVLTSREDPFPLVCLEAAALGKPIIAFENAGGTRELIEDDCGFLVPYLDIPTMADKVLDLMASPDLRTRVGQRAAEKVRNRFSIAVVGPRIAHVIQESLAPGRGAEIGGRVVAFDQSSAESE